MSEGLRRQFMAAGFRERDAAREPMAQFTHWYKEAQEAGLRLPHAMTLATVNAAGRPAARLVLMTGHTESGFAYYTDARSAKAAHTAAVPWVALVFHWPGLERQVRVEGTVAPLSEAEADAQWEMRAWAPKLGAWVGQQSEVVASRAVLEEALLRLIARYEHAPIPRPPHYHGFLVEPTQVEFWQGRDDWLHDRIRYRAQVDSTWLIERLAP